jgi:hypothetical protein
MLIAHNLPKTRVKIYKNPMEKNSIYTLFGEMLPIGPQVQAHFISSKLTCPNS